MSTYKKCGAKTRTGGTCGQRAMSNGRCYMHGGKSLKGINSPNFKTGLYSKDIPTQLAARYHEALADPDLLSLNNDIALVHAVITERLKEASKGDLHPAWIDAQKWYNALNEAIAKNDEQKLLEAIAELGKVIRPNYQARIALNDALGQMDRKSHLTDKERRALIDRQKVITIERVMLLIGVILTSLRESVQRYCDNDTARRILSDTQTAYSRAVGTSESIRTIDAG